MSTKRILIIVPHADDEVLSFGSYIYDNIKLGHEIYIRYLAVGGDHPKLDYTTRVNESKLACNILGVDYNNVGIYYQGFDSTTDQIPISKIIAKIDYDLDHLKPDVVLSCYPSSHQDHKILYSAFMAAMRLRDGWMPNRVGLGEYPFILTSLNTPDGGKWYHPMDSESFNAKLKAFGAYASQLKPPPSPLGIRGVEILANTRGLECGREYAELIYIQKLID